MRESHFVASVAAAILAATILVPAGARGLFEGGCVAPDNGSGTIDLPPEGCDYLAPDGVFEVTDGLPPLATIDLEPRLTDFACVNSPCGQPGGNLGGEVEQYTATLVLQVSGSGDLAGLLRTVRVQAVVESHSAPRVPGDPIQSFDTDLFSFNTLPLAGDPDFATLQIVAGGFFTLPSPGHTVLEDNFDGNFNVDSIFDVSYQIDYVGAPGGALDGLSGSNQGAVRIEAFAGKLDAIEPDLLSGTIELPPAGAKFVNPIEAIVITDGLPPGDTIEIEPTLHYFVCLQDSQFCGFPGGTLGGEAEPFTATLDLLVTGTGSLAGFTRSLSLSANAQTFSAPRTPGDPVQIFDAELFTLQGALFGDPDFDELQMVAGAADGFPSPGHTTLNDLGDGSFLVDSFFDVHYLIEYLGAPGGALDGLSGMNEGNVRITACDDLTCPTIVDVPSQTFNADQAIVSAGIARSSGDLDVQASVDIVARHLVTLGNGFSATVGPAGTLSIWTEIVPCPLFDTPEILGAQRRVSAASRRRVPGGGP